jgi:folate-binding protein YgfZ
MTPSDLLAGLVGNGPLARDDAPYRLLRVAGVDAGEFLHRLCSQDVLGLRDGEVRPAAFLDAKGRLQATCLVGRAADAFWLEVAAERSELLAALLERYHFTEALQIQREPAAACREVVALLAGGAPGERRIEVRDGRPTIWCARRGVQFVRSHGTPGGPASAGVLTSDAAECVRMLVGFVRTGVETEATTLALEADLDDHISTTKGCYTGQEIVARIHTYGHVNRRLCLLLLAAGAPFAAPRLLHEPQERAPVGRVLHAVAIPGREARLGVGFLPKDFQAIGTRLLDQDGGEVVVIGYGPLTA